MATTFEFCHHFKGIMFVHEFVKDESNSFWTIPQAYRVKPDVSRNKKIATWSVILKIQGFV